MIARHRDREVTAVSRAGDQARPLGHGRDLARVHHRGRLPVPGLLVGRDFRWRSDQVCRHARGNLGVLGCDARSRLGPDHRLHRAMRFRSLAEWPRAAGVNEWLPEKLFAQDPKRAPGDVASLDPNWWTRYDDPKEREFKLNAERNNGRAAMMGIVGMMIHEALTGNPLFPLAAEPVTSIDGAWWEAR